MEKASEALVLFTEFLFSVPEVESKVCILCRRKSLMVNVFYTSSFFYGEAHEVN